MKFLFHFGRYFVFLTKVFSKPEKHRLFFRQLVIEMDKLGINSIGIVFIISIFIGAVLTLQTAYNMTNPFIPKYLIGLGTRDSMLLEFSSTIVGLILAGKIGSSIASEIGTMRVTEQIDALEIMGINSSSLLVLPKIAAAVIINPFLNILSIFTGIFGGWLMCALTGMVSPTDYVFGLKAYFVPYYVVYSMVKTVVFAFIITSVPAYHGYHASGGALEVGRSSTRAVVFSSILILVFNLILTQLMLS